MTHHATRKLTLALMLITLMAPLGKAFAQSTTPVRTPAPTSPTSPSPNTVTGSDPEPIDWVVFSGTGFALLP